MSVDASSPLPPPRDGAAAAVACVDFQALVHASQEDSLRAVLDSYNTIGLQATAVGRARDLLQSILFHKKQGHRVFLSYTSNLISSGLRDTFAYLAREKLVDCFISSAGGIEEDAIKCLGKTVVGRFDLDGKELRKRGYNRIGNLLVPNDNYCHFEDYFMQVIKDTHARQQASAWEEATAPSDLIHAMGRALETQGIADRESSLLYWCYKNDIPVFSPALTDGSMGDMIYFFNFSKKGLVVDPMQDVLKIRALAQSASPGACAGIVLGGGLPKHYLMSNVPLRRVVMVTTGLEADGCTSACVPADDRACGLLPARCQYVRVQGDATLIFPLLMAKKASKQHRGGAEGSDRNPATHQRRKQKKTAAEDKAAEPDMKPIEEKEAQP